MRTLHQFKYVEIVKRFFKKDAEDKEKGLMMLAEAINPSDKEEGKKQGAKQFLCGKK